MSALSKEAILVHEALVARGLETPLRPPVQEIDNETRKSLIAGHMTEIMQLLNLDLTDDSLMETPRRIAKMYVDEIFRAGLCQVPKNHRYRKQDAGR
jgi:GTP cyclohydrolase I